MPPWPARGSTCRSGIHSMAEPAVDATDPDNIANCPPDKVIDAKTFFQVGTHEGKWSEYDDRGVPTKNLKKKKPTKKEKEELEVAYLEQAKAYQKYLKDVENWEQAKLDAEKALKKSDRLRWAFRQIGQKYEPIELDEMETIIKLMGWKALTPKEFKVVRKGLTEIANSKSQIELDALRAYVRDVMPSQLLEERLQSEQLEAVELDIYSPRTWRRKLEENPPPQKKGSKSPRTGSAKISSARGKARKEGAVSPRGGSAPSPRGKKAPAGGSAPSPRGKRTGKRQDSK